MGSSVDGLASGLNTSSMITQLMQVESAPQTKLKTKVATAQTVISSYQSVNSKLKATKSAADSLGSLASWRALTATSSSTGVTATASGGLAGMTGNLKFDVSSVARAQTSIIKVADTTAEGTFPTSITIQPGSWSTDSNGVDQFTAVGDPVEVTIPEPRKADSLTAAVNSAADANGVSLGIRAYPVTTSGNEGVVQFTGMKTGAASGFQITGLEGIGTNGSGLETTAAKDATLTVNPGTAAEYKVNSTTNTFSALMPGVTIAVSKLETGVTIDATSDSTAITAKMQALVDAANASLAEIKSQTAYDPDTRAGSPLTGDFTVRQMNQSLLSMISNGLTYDKTTTVNGVESKQSVNFGSLSQLGVSLSKDGQLAFDATAFAKAYADDPTKVQEAGMAFGSQVRTLNDKQSKIVTNVITGRKDEIDSLNEQIENWDVRLAVRKESLQRQYAALESSLGKLKNQGNWLSGQLAG
ncbi:flagellar filament capping protein FliD [Actinoplanes couchii]|uniref:Flagellar hook-associated protein 2 n=1 Tax=Actinoplanes couchii TaxID=403638 RepID=A0ABQ3XA65_9ACTN|nr:flagellar filament capping protein FliD [Actinoplanes couchii]MDR6324976.1 flagellar hook-associated protein 2 [Actinoplanes couchii]GID55403.1 flagellar hook-associated protein 2 [Actinoplanes couchii]